MNKVRFIRDLLFAFLSGGGQKIDKELEAWEDTVEIMNDPKLMDKITEVRSQIAKSSPNA